MVKSLLVLIDKNQPIQKIPNQATQYSCQMYLCNFIICQGESTDLQGNMKLSPTFSWKMNILRDLMK